MIKTKKHKPVENQNFSDIEWVHSMCVFATCGVCGGRKSYQATNLRKAKSCGCLGKNTSGLSPAVVHGQSKTPLYHAWSKMKQRCLNPQHPSFKDYGARGITISPEWMDFQVFAEDMGEKPPNRSLGRIDNDKGYSKHNCRWETRVQQQRNTRRNIRLTAQGVTLTLPEWAQRTGISYLLLYTRVVREGWTMERALAEPKHNTRGKAYG